MTTKDVLAILLLNTWEQGVDDQARSLAPIIEKFGRAAYDEGATEHRLFGVQDLNNSHGVTAGVAAMVEEL